MYICQDLVRKQHTQTELLEDSLIQNKTKPPQQNNYWQSVGGLWRAHGVQNCGASLREAQGPAQGLKGQGESSFQSLERAAVGRGTPCGQHEINGPPSPSSQLLVSCRYLPFWVQAKPEAREPFDKVHVDPGWTVALQRHMKNIQHTLLFLRARI